MFESTVAKLAHDSGSTRTIGQAKVSLVHLQETNGQNFPMTKTMYVFVPMHVAVSGLDVWWVEHAL